MLHKFNTIRGFHIHALDGEIGHLDDILLDESTWELRYLVIDTANWIGGRHVLLSPNLVTAIDVEHERIEVSLTREEIEHSRSIESADIPLVETLPTIWIM
jgi:PRC-barrel domain